MRPLFSIHGQVALATGAGSADGIGFATARLLNVTRLALPGMIRREHGRIINVSSVTEPLVSGPGAAAYSAARAAMTGRSRSIALEVAMYNLTINSVAPGWVAG